MSSAAPTACPARAATRTAERRRQGARRRRDREHDQPELERLAAAEQVGEAAGRHETGREDDRVRVQHPRERGGRAAGEALLDRGERDVDDEEVELGHERPDGDHGEDPAGARAGRGALGREGGGGWVGIGASVIAWPFTRVSLPCMSPVIGLTPKPTYTSESCQWIQWYDPTVLPRTYDAQNCSLARALEIVGERWTLLILRDVFLGVRRFDDFQERLDVSRTVLAGRLQRLVEEGILARERYQERPDRYEYVLTQKGRDLWPAINALRAWGDVLRDAERGTTAVRPRAVRDADRGRRVLPALRGRRPCRRTFSRVAAPDIALLPEASARPAAQPTHLLEPSV